MPKQKTALIASLCALVMILMFGLSFWLSSRTYRSDSQGIVLPSELDIQAVIGAQEAVFADENAVRIAQIEITPDNVQQVIASLSRPDAYSCAVSNTLYWQNGNAVLQCRRYVREGADRIEQLDSSGTVSAVTLFYDGRLYAWSAGATTYYSGQAGAFSPTEQAMLPTYETVCTLPPEQILDAALTEFAGQPMIRVSAMQDGLTAEYVISTVTGLLYSASFSRDGVRIRSIQTSVLSLDPPHDTYFTLPGADAPIFS